MQSDTRLTNAIVDRAVSTAHQSQNDQRNRAAAVDVDFNFRVIRRSD